MKEAIQKAIEGGLGDKMVSYKHKAGWVSIVTTDGDGYTKRDYKFAELWMSPSFWQSLGKAMGWEKEYGGNTRWRTNWHMFIDHLIEGKDPEEFFKKLLK